MSSQTVPDSLLRFIRYVQIDTSGNVSFTDRHGNVLLKLQADKKAGLFGASPIVQPSAVGSATGYTAGATVATFHSDDTYTGNTGATAYTINGVIAALKNLGLLAP